MKKIVVIGAGILGASAAYHLTKLGAQVTIIDRKDAGQATDAAAGIVCPWVSQRRNKAWYQLVKKGARYYPELIDALEEDGETGTGYKRVGALVLQQDPEKMEKIIVRTEKRKQDAPEIGELIPLTKEETKEKFPLLSEEYSSVHVEGAARVDGRALRDALLHAAEKNGAKLISGDAALIFQQGRVTGALLKEEAIEADEIIVCAGAWANQVLQPLGIHFQVSYQKAQIAHFKMETEHTSDWPVLMPPANHYLLAFDDGRIVAGATHEDDVKGYDTRVTAGGMLDVFSKAMNVAPGLEEGTFLEARTGFRPFTPGFLPVIGRIPEWSGLIAANGLGASGLTMGPYLGLELARLALGLEPEIDLADYPITGALEE
ncbi:FAD-binding oxidoreductase [Metabacillus indicus]|uniref:NAD(P)/FAD-dependent oxidoreductase n=1 Tax=Metabacillus indicus TaxID=246786 RepID=UPI0031771FAA